MFPRVAAPDPLPTRAGGLAGAIRVDPRSCSVDAWRRLKAMVREDRCTVPAESMVLSASGWAQMYDAGSGVLVSGAAHLVNDDRAVPNSRSAPTLATVASLYRTHGIDAFARLNGQFCLAIYDASARRLVLVTDRFSTRVLYYAHENGCVCFSSQLDALASGRSIDHAAILEYLLYAAIPHPRTPFVGIAKLPPAHVLIADSAGVRDASYWSMSYPEERDGSPARWATALRREIESAITRYVNAEPDIGRVGAFLSGGTDSSTVAGVLRKAAGPPTRTFSIGYAEAGYDELSYARAAVRQFGLEQHEHILTAAEALAALPDVVSYYQEPFGNSSALATYACARAAREHGITVLLAGDGGDELFAGNTRYKSDKILGLYQQLPEPLRRLVTDPLTGLIPSQWPLLGLIPRYVRRSNLPNPQRFFSYNLLLSSPLTTLLAPDFLAAVDTSTLLASAEEPYHACGATTAELNRLMHVDLKLAIADNDIRKVSGMTELAGVEVRYPLLDTQLAEFSGRIPSHLKLRGFKTRYLFKRALADFLPPEILAKPKHGFGVPVARWMKSEPDWSALVADILHDRETRQRGYLQPAALDELWRQHQTEQSSYYGDMLWPLIMLELWHRRPIDGKQG